MAKNSPAEAKKEQPARIPIRGEKQMLQVKLDQTRSRLALLENCLAPLTPMQECIFDKCKKRIAEAHACLDRWIKRSYAFWGTIHDVDELLLLVTPPEQLLPQAVGIREDFKNRFQDKPELCWAWVGDKGLLTNLIERLENQVSDKNRPENTQGTDQEILRNALHMINNQTDYGFWQLNMNVLVQVLSAVILASAVIPAIILFLKTGIPNQVTKTPGSFLVILAGIAGAMVSNISERDVTITVVGATRRYFLYYLVVKPIIGAFAAMFIYLLEKSGLLFKIVLGMTNAAESNPPIQIVVENPEALVFVFAVIFVVSGYFGVKLLSSIFEDVIGKIFQNSEKVICLPHKQQKNCS